MRKINKRYITALIVTIVGMVFLPSPAYSLRVPSSTQSPDFSKEFDTAVKAFKKYRYYGPHDKCYYKEPDGSLRARDMDKQSVIQGLLRIPSIKKSFRKKESVTVFNLGSGVHPFRSFDNYDITNFDPDFPFQTNNWRPSEKAMEHGAKFELKEITDIKDRCSIVIWHDLPYFIDYHAEQTSIWKDTSGDGREPERQVIEKSLQHTWEIIDEGGYFVITTSRIDEYKGFYANDVYEMIKKLGFDISEVHVVGESIKEAKTIILRKTSNNAQTELASGDGIQFPQETREMLLEIRRFRKMSLGILSNLQKTEYHKQYIIKTYPEEERQEITALINSSDIHGRVMHHAVRLLDNNRTEVEHQFGRALFEFYKEDDIQSRYPATHIVMQKEGLSTMLFYTIAPYLYNELLKLHIDREIALEIVCSWVKKEAYKDFEDSPAKFVNTNYLIATFRLSPFLLRDENSHNFARLIAQYILAQEVFQDIVLDLLASSKKMPEIDSFIKLRTDS